MMMFDDKVGGWGWLNDDVIKRYTRKTIYPFEDITDQFNSSDLFIKERKKILIGGRVGGNDDVIIKVGIGNDDV